MSKRPSFNASRPSYQPPKAVPMLAVWPPAPRLPVPAWFMAKLRSDKAARITAEAAAAVAAAIVQAEILTQQDEAEELAYDAMVDLMGATTEFTWTADENGFSPRGYRSGYHLRTLRPESAR